MHITPHCIAIWRRTGCVAPGLRTNLAAACILIGLTVSAIAAPACPATPQLPAMHLPHLRASLAARAEGVIVALGSSSTEGVMASDPGHSYPAILQADLAALWPAAHIAVINRGVGGQDAPEELARMQADAIAVRPQLVIWQVGANGAMRDASPDVFRSMVAEGVAHLRAAGIDVILMDNQRSPRIIAAADHVALEAALAQVAVTSGANLFSRGRLMDAWSQAGDAPAEFIATDGLHHNDLGYRCVADALAAEIAAAVHTPAAVTAGR
jgi:lysophospholipase L1-like esterase